MKKSILAYVALGIAFACMLGLLSYVQRYSTAEGLWLDAENVWPENECIGFPANPSDIVKNPTDNVAATVCGKLSISGNDFLLLDHNANVYVTLKNAENWRDWNGRDIAVFGTVRWTPAVIGM